MSYGERRTHWHAGTISEVTLELHFTRANVFAVIVRSDVRVIYEKLQFMTSSKVVRTNNDKMMHEKKKEKEMYKN